MRTSSESKRSRISASDSTKAGRRLKLAPGPEVTAESGTPSVRPFQGSSGFATRLLIRSTGRMLLVSAEEIDWIEAAGNYSRLRIGGRSHLLRESLSSLEQRLDPVRFLRIHRSTIVNLDRVVELTLLLHGDYTVLLRDGSRLTLSRRYRAAFDGRVAGARHGLLFG